MERLEEWEKEVNKQYHEFDEFDEELEENTKTNN